MVLGCDLVVTGPKASFNLPDVKVGLTGLGGAFPRLVHRIGRQRATDMVLTGRVIGVSEAQSWGLVDRAGQDALEEAIKLAMEIVANSPDAIIASRDGLLMGEGAMGGREAGQAFIAKWLPIVNGENCQEGIDAFLERRKPIWKLSKL